MLVSLLASYVNWRGQGASTDGKQKQQQELQETKPSLLRGNY